MAHKDELVGAKMAPSQAAVFGDDLTTGLTATGSAQTDALALSTSISAFSTVASNTGARLPAASGKGEYAVMNGGANTLKVYPATGERINAGSANAAFSVAAGKCAYFRPVGQEWYAVVSA